MYKTTHVYSNYLLRTPAWDVNLVSLVHLRVGDSNRGRWYIFIIGHIFLCQHRQTFFMGAVTNTEQLRTSFIGIAPDYSFLYK